jgi:hypothetical protein
LASGPADAGLRASLEEKPMRAVLSLAFCFGLVLSATSAIAAPVSRADLSGKKFCWNDGGTETYYADGRYSSTHDGEGKWAVTDKGVEISTNSISGVADMQKLPDGTYTATWQVDGKPKTWTGHLCE